MSEAVAQAFGLHFSTASRSANNYQDDLLSVMQFFSEHYSDSRIDHDVLDVVYRMLDIRLDHAVEPQADWLFKNAMLQRCLGMQLSFGYHGERIGRSLRARIAQGFLDVRAIVLITTYTLKSKPPNQNAESEAKRAGELLFTLETTY